MVGLDRPDLWFWLYEYNTFQFRWWAWRDLIYDYDYKYEYNILNQMVGLERPDGRMVVVVTNRHTVTPLSSSASASSSSSSWSSSWSSSFFSFLRQRKVISAEEGGEERVLARVGATPRPQYDCTREEAKHQQLLLLLKEFKLTYIIAIYILQKKKY